MLYALAVLTACAPALNWRAVQVDEADGLTALFPCKPERFERKVPWPGVPAGVTMRMLGCEAQGRNWAVSYVTMPDVTLVAPALQQWPGMTLANLKPAGASSAEARAHDLGPVDVPRMTPSNHARAWFLEGERLDGQGQATKVGLQAWHFVHGMTVFQASVSGVAQASDRQSSEDVAQAFFSGFHFPG